MKKRYYLLLPLAFVIFTGCQNPNQKTGDKRFEVTTDETESSREETRAVPDLVFYNLFSPVDVEHVIDEKNGPFNADFLNSVNNAPRYTDSYKMALNLGVYGADLSYLWIYDQTQQAFNYLATIQVLTEKLGIPKDFVDFTLLSVEHNSDEIDTLKSIARDAYVATDRYLKGSERENAAVLILLGGWIESLHIALNLYQETDSKLAGKILTQKYSLNSLINMVQNQHDDLKMSEYLLLLKKLNDAFATFESRLSPNDIEIDTVNKTIRIKEDAPLQIEPESFAELKQQVETLRLHIVG